MKEFKIRCSAIGKIMAGSVGLTDAQQKELDGLNDRKNDPNAKDLTPAMEKKLEDLWYKYKNPILPQGAKTYCDSWLKEQVYQRRKEFTSKYTDKGNIVEDNSIDFIAEQLGLPEFKVFKNDKEFEDEYKTGTPDIIFDKMVIDAKNPWSWETFPLLEKEIPEKDYYYQGQGYMSLTGLRSFKLCYVLSDTPRHLIEKEAFYYCKNNGIEMLDMDMVGKPYDDETLTEFTKLMTYDDVELKFKFKSYDVEYDQKVIDDIHTRVKMCRKYIDERVKELEL